MHFTTAMCVYEHAPQPRLLVSGPPLRVFPILLRLSTKDHLLHHHHGCSRRSVTTPKMASWHCIRAQAAMAPTVLSWPLRSWCFISHYLSVQARGFRPRIVACQVRKWGESSLSLATPIDMNGPLSQESGRVQPFGCQDPYLVDLYGNGEVIAIPCHPKSTGRCQRSACSFC